jgi:coenzyme F420-reducing hydrogenase beta subunit
VIKTLVLAQTKERKPRIMVVTNPHQVAMKAVTKEVYVMTLSKRLSARPRRLYLELILF